MKSSVDHKIENLRVLLSRGIPCTHCSFDESFDDVEHRVDELFIQLIISVPSTSRQLSRRFQIVKHVDLSSRILSEGKVR